MLPPDWIEHRRPDGETVGWIVPDGDGFRARDLLGREVTDRVVDWLAAEEILESWASATSPTATCCGCRTVRSARSGSPRRACGVSRWSPTSSGSRPPSARRSSGSGSPFPAPDELRSRERGRRGREAAALPDLRAGLLSARSASCAW